MPEKTEPPTAKRIRDARKKGQFLFSREVVAVSTLASVALMIFLLKNTMYEHFTQLIVATTNVNDNVLQLAGEISVAVVFAILIFAIATYSAGILASIIANLFQVGLVFSGAKISQGLKSLDVLNNAKQMFSKKNLFTFLFNIVKIIVIAITCFWVTRHLFRDLLLSPECGLACVGDIGSSAFLYLTGIVTAVFIPVAVTDYLIQRYLYLAELKMSLDEIKQEYKETEGNPEIKSHRKQLHREIVMSDTRQKAAKSSVMITNPTHCCVALRYVADKTPLPLIMAKGEGTIAKMLIDIAKQENIPIYQDVDLAWQLFADAELDHYVPEHLLRSVATVIRIIEHQQQMQ